MGIPIKFHTNSTDRGQRLLEFAGKHRLVAANKLFPHKKSRYTTNRNH